jgi:hypothetical protein
MKYFTVVLHLCCMMGLTLASGLPDKFRPFQLVRPNESHTGFEVVSESVSRLLSASAKKRIAVVSVVGPYHSGKSFLLNALIGRTDVFSVGPKTSPETMGLWMCRTDITLPDHSDVEVWFVDSEGFFGPKVPEAYDAKVFTLSMLLGDEFVYNTVKIIDAQAVGLLEMLARRAQLFRTKSTSSENVTDIVTHKVGFLPHLTWVVEDFVQLKESNGDSVSSATTQWLETYLEDDPYLRRIFPDLTVQSLFLPATSREQLSDLSRVPFANLTADFRHDLADLRASIINRLNSRSSFVSVKDFGHAVYFFGKTLDKGLFPELPSLWNSWQSQVAQNSLNDAIELFAKSLASRVDGSGTPPPGRSEFVSIVSAAHESSLTLFRELVKDFAVSGESEDLGSRMKLRFTQSSTQWTENVRKFLNENLREEFNNFLKNAKSFTRENILFEPKNLHEELSLLAAERIGNFTTTVSKFDEDSSLIDLPSGWSVPVYPSFSVDPVSQLRSELQAQIDSILVKNEKSISEMIKSVGLLAASSVDQQISNVAGKLFDRAGFEKAASNILNSTVALYHSELVRTAGPWISTSSPQYDSIRSRLETDVREKLTRFKSSHSNRLSDWMNKQAEKALTVYRDQVSVIATSSLPCDETVLKSNHDKAIEILIHTLDTDSGAKAYTDSDAYESTRSRLNSIVESEFAKLRKKNIELWKVHSDSATQCAIEANHKYALEHCPQGWFCLFRTWPGTFRAKSLHHLLTCFNATSSKSKIPPESVRTQIFESWFEKDLAPQTAEVKFNMWVGLVSILVPVAWIFYVKYVP